MKRSSFKRPELIRVKQALYSIVRQAKPWTQGPIEPVEKEVPLRDESYRRWTASQDCIHCNYGGGSQAAHADEGKGMGIKADDRRVFPLCASKPARAGCHVMFGASGTFRQEHRRLLEDRYVRLNQERAIDQRKWPKHWPLPEWARRAA